MNLHKYSEFHDACRAGDIERVREILATAKDPSAPMWVSDEDWTALYHAAGHGFSSIVQSVLATSKNASALVAMQSVSGWTPLHYAVREGHADIVQSLLAASEDPWTLVALRNEDGWTPLHSAAWYGYSNILQSLLPYAFVLPSIDAYKNESVRCLLRRAHRRRAWAFLETSLPEDLARALPAFF